MQSTTIPAAHNPANYSPQQVIDTINRMSGSAHPTTRYAVLDERTQQPVVLPSPLLVDTGKITNDTTQNTHRSLAITLLEPVGLNTLQHLIQPWFGFNDNAGNLLFEVPLGVFRPVLPDRLLQDSQNIWTIAGLDRTVDITIIPFANDYAIPSGNNVIGAVVAMMMMDQNPRSEAGARQPISSPYVWPDANNPGMTPSGLDDEGPNFPAARIRATPTTFTTIGPVIGTRQDKKSDIANTMLDTISYYPLWVDEGGSLRLQPKPYYNGSTPAVEWTYATDATSIIRPGVQQQLSNQADLVNCVGLECAPSGGPVIYSEQKNHSTDSAISIPNRGKTVRRNLQNNLIATQAQADLAAYIALVEFALQTDTVSWSTAINPLHQSHDIVALNVRNRDGKPEISSSAHPYIMISHSWDLNTYVQTNVAGRLVLV